MGIYWHIAVRNASMHTCVLSAHVGGRSVRMHLIPSPCQSKQTDPAAWFVVRMCMLGNRVSSRVCSIAKCGVWAQVTAQLRASDGGRKRHFRLDFTKVLAASRRSAVSCPRARLQAYVWNQSDHRHG